MSEMEVGKRYTFRYGDVQVTGTAASAVQVELEDVGPYPGGLAMKRRLVAIQTFSHVVVDGAAMPSHLTYAIDVNEVNEVNEVSEVLTAEGESARMK